jgi:serine/threonine protein kinase
MDPKLIVVSLHSKCFSLLVLMQNYECNKKKHNFLEFLTYCFMYLYTGASRELNWNISFKIIQGICQGLQFLHELQRPIIHMDLKPGNILLDDSLMPKIADFGLSRLFGEEQTGALTSNVVGSR